MRGDFSSQKQVDDDNTFLLDFKETKGKYHVKGRNVVSKDGKTMTGTATGTDAEGKPVAYTVVNDKQ
jgi:hypothetical protein